MLFPLTHVHRMIEDCALSTLYLLAHQLELDNRIPCGTYTIVDIIHLGIKVYSQECTLYEHILPVWTYGIWIKSSKKVVLALDHNFLLVYKFPKSVHYKDYVKKVDELYGLIPHKNLLAFDTFKYLDNLCTLNTTSSLNKIRIFRANQNPRFPIKFTKIDIPSHLKKFFLPYKSITLEKYSVYVKNDDEWKLVVYISYTSEIVDGVSSDSPEFIIDDWITIFPEGCTKGISPYTYFCSVV